MKLGNCVGLFHSPGGESHRVYLPDFANGYCIKDTYNGISCVRELKEEELCNIELWESEPEEKYYHAVSVCAERNA